MAEKTQIHLDTRDGLFALKEIVDAQPNVRNEKEWADAFFDMACVLRMIKMLDGGAEFPVFTDCANTPDKCKEGNASVPSVNDTVATEDNG